LPGLMSLDLMDPSYCVSTVQAAGAVMVWRIFSGCT